MLRLFFFFTYTLARPARPPRAAQRLGSAGARRTADDLDRDLAAIPAGGRLEGEQLAVMQPGARLARRVDRAELEVPVGDGDALDHDLRRHGPATGATAANSWRPSQAWTSTPIRPPSIVIRL